MALFQIEQVILTENHLLEPKDGSYYIQSGNCGTVVFETNFVPSQVCMFSIQTNKFGLYILNNSSCKYNGNRFLAPQKIHLFNILYKDGSWEITSDTSSSNNVVNDWTVHFYSNLTNPPPLASRKYALFINSAYNNLVTYKNLQDEAVVNESLRKACSVFLPSLNTESVYNKYDKLSDSDKSLIENSVNTFLNDYPIPDAAKTSNPTNVPKTDQDKWHGVNPVLPNWNPSNIPYLTNTFTDIPHNPSSTMADDAKTLSDIVRTPITNEIAYHFANTPPPAHLTRIACLALSDKTIFDLTKVLSFISISIADAGLFAWTAKYTYWGARPFQYIEGYNPLITTPNFPGYISGHSTFSAAWAQSIALIEPKLKNISKYVAELSGISRLYGGIHFNDDNITGLNSGYAIGKSVYNTLILNIKNGEKFL
jgi:membrane-associated phospholipid phosphatase